MSEGLSAYCECGCTPAGVWEEGALRICWREAFVGGELFGGSEADAVPEEGRFAERKSPAGADGQYGGYDL